MISIFAGTGHRPDKLGGYSDDAYDKVYDIASAALHKHQPSLVISGMALGWDTALAEAAHIIGIPFHAYVPFEGQESRWQWQAKLLYRNLLKEAAEVKICSPGGFSVAAMMKRNRDMVDACTTVLALWNGDTEGGTAKCVEYAMRKGRPIINLWDEFHA